MNIVSNNCIGARLYDLQKKQFVNPFCWSAITDEDFIKLIENWDNMDFGKSTFELEDYWKGRYNHNYQTVLATIDYDIKLHFIHHIYSETCTEITKRGNTEVVYKGTVSYCKELWNKRLQRMNEEPVFLFSFNPMDPDSENYKKLLETVKTINTEYKLILLLHENVEFVCDRKNISVIRLDKVTMKSNITTIGKKLSRYIKID